MKTLEPITRIALKNLLFATDFSACSNAALPYALAIAHQYNAKLFAVHVLTPGSYLLFASPENWPAVLEAEEEKHQINTARLEEKLRGVAHQVLSPAGDVSDVIFRLVREHAIDMLVLGTHGREGMKKLLMGSVGEKIFRQSSVPVMIIGPNVPVRTSVAELNRLVFATDFSDESLVALPHALSLAQEHQAHLSILHVLQEPCPGTSVDFEPDTRFALRRMKELVPPESSLYLAPHYAVEFGDVTEQITKHASENGADLIILGIRQARAGMGSVTHFTNTTAQQIVAHATCPVLTVRGCVAG
jgi:nucleotide-binding universal stress UspA family protein